MVEDDRDPRKPIVDFLGEWQIKSIDFGGVTVEHLITGEVEIYAVDYTPEKKVKDNAQSGYGQGFIVDASPAVDCKLKCPTFLDCECFMPPAPE